MTSPPRPSWAAIAAGQHDAEIDAMLQVVRRHALPLLACDGAASGLSTGACRYLHELQASPVLPAHNPWRDAPSARLRF